MVIPMVMPMVIPIEVASSYLNPLQKPSRTITITIY